MLAVTPLHWWSGIRSQVCRGVLCAWDTVNMSGALAQVGGYFRILLTWILAMLVTVVEWARKRSG